MLLLLMRPRWCWARHQTHLQCVTHDKAAGGDHTVIWGTAAQQSAESPQARQRYSQCRHKMMERPSLQQQQSWRCWNPRSRYDTSPSEHHTHPTTTHLPQTGQGPPSHPLPGLFAACQAAAVAAAVMTAAPVMQGRLRQAKDQHSTQQCETASRFHAFVSRI